MRRLITILFLLIHLVSFGQYEKLFSDKNINPYNLILKDKFIWLNKEVKRDSLVYAELKTDSVRFRYFDGNYTNWFYVPELSGIRDTLSILDLKIDSVANADETDPEFYLWLNNVNFQDSVLTYQVFQNLTGIRDTLEFHRDSLRTAYERLIEVEGFDTTGIYHWNRGLLDAITAIDTTRWGEVMDLSDYATRTELTDTSAAIRATIPTSLTELDSTGFTITESQIADLEHFSGEYDSLLNRPILMNNAHEGDPLFKNWNRTDGINIYSKQIFDWDGKLEPYALETDITGGVLDVDFTSLAINGTDLGVILHDTANVVRSEIPTLLTELDSTGFRITESQISDLQNYQLDSDTLVWDATKYDIDTLGFLRSYTETDPVFSTHTASSIVNGTGFLKNNGTGTWSYDNSTYLTVNDLSNYVTKSGTDTITGQKSFFANPIIYADAPKIANRIQSSTSVSSGLIIIDDIPSNAVEFGYNNNLNTSYIWNYQNNDFRIGLNSTEMFRFKTDGSLIYKEQITSPSTPTSGFGATYIKDDGKIYFKNDAGTEYDLTSGVGGTSLWESSSGFINPINNENISIEGQDYPLLRFKSNLEPTHTAQLYFDGLSLRGTYYNGSTTYTPFLYSSTGIQTTGLLLSNSANYMETNGSIRYNGTDILGRVGGSWVSLTSGSGTTLSEGAGIDITSNTISLDINTLSLDNSPGATPYFSYYDAVNGNVKAEIGAFDADYWGSGTATDGYVLTADGAGNAAWEIISGGSGTPGGLSGQIQYNNNGAFGGFGNYNGSRVMIDNRLNIYNSLSSYPNFNISHNENLISMGWHSSDVGSITGGFTFDVANALIGVTGASFKPTTITDENSSTGAVGEVLTRTSTGIDWAAGGSGGTVTSVAAGNGMNFTTITSSGSVTMGTPSSITTSSTNSVTTTSHTHALDLSGRSVLTQYSLTGGGNLGSNRTLNLVGDVAAPGISKYYGTNSSGTRGWYDLGTGYWTRSGTSLYPSTITDEVMIGGTTDMGGWILQVYGNIWSNATLTMGEVGSVATPSSGYGIVWIDNANSKLYFTNDAGTNYDLTSTGPNVTVLSLSGTAPSWNMSNGINAKITLSGNTTITLSNVPTGYSGNLTITNAATAYTVQFLGYTVKISPFLDSASGVITMSGESEVDMLSWYYDGNYVFINGTFRYD